MVLARISCIDRARVMADGAAAGARPSSETAADGGDADPLLDGLVGGSQTPADANKKRLRQSSLWRYASPASRKRKRIQEGRKRAQEHAQAMWCIYREGHLADIRQMAMVMDIKAIQTDALRRYVQCECHCELVGLPY